MLVAAVGSGTHGVGGVRQAVGESAFLGGRERVGAACVGVEEAQDIPAEQGVDDSHFVHENAVVMGGLVGRRHGLGGFSAIIW